MNIDIKHLEEVTNSVYKGESMKTIHGLDLHVEAFYNRTGKFYFEVVPVDNKIFFSYGGNRFIKTTNDIEMLIAIINMYSQKGNIDE